MGKKKKLKMEYRHYEMPPNSPVLALLGEGWIRDYGDGKPIDCLHFHNHMEIGFCYWGEGILDLDGKEVPYSGDMFSIIPKKFPHTTNAEGHGPSSWEYLFIDVDKFLTAIYQDNPHMAEKMIRRVNRKAHFCRVEEKSEIAVLIRQIIEIMRDRKELYLEEVKGLTLALMMQIARWNKAEEDIMETHGGNSATISGALEYISRHFSEQLKVEELAEMFHVSETHFRRVFTENMGKTPMEYINWIRINAACEQLKRTKDSISTIAVNVGFSTLTTFNRNFRKLMKVSPQEWRNNPEHYERKLLEYDVSKHQGWL